MSADAGEPWRTADIPLDKLDELPCGAVVIDQAGTILAYNQYEARLSHLDAQRVIGKNFFQDVAPCTAVQAFEGRMRDFMKSRERVSSKFDYFFPFKHGNVEVTIMFIKMPDAKSFLIAVERKDRAPV